MKRYALLCLTLGSGSALAASVNVKTQSSLSVDDRVFTANTVGTKNITGVKVGASDLPVTIMDAEIASGTESGRIYKVVQASALEEDQEAADDSEYGESEANGEKLLTVTAKVYVPIRVGLASTCLSSFGGFGTKIDVQFSSTASSTQLASTVGGMGNSATIYRISSSSCPTSVSDSGWFSYTTISDYNLTTINTSGVNMCWMAKAKDANGEWQYEIVKTVVSGANCTATRLVETP